MKISEYNQIETIDKIDADAYFIVELEDGSRKVSGQDIIDLIEGNSIRDYADLDNKPQINSVELDGDTSLDDLGIQAELTDGSISSNLLADGSVAQNKLYTGVVGTKTYQGGGATYEDGVLTITYSTDSEWRGGGFYIKLFKGVNTIVKAKIDENVEYTANWYTWVDTATPKSRPISTVDGSVTIKDGYMYFEIPASFEEAYGSDMALLNMLRNTTAGKTVLSDIRVYPHKAFDATYVAEALGTGGATELDDLTDIDLTSPSNNQILKYDSSTGKWKNANESGGGGGADDLNDLNDVSITSALNGQVLKYDSTSQKWKNSAESVGVDELTELTDVTLSSPSNGQVLKYNSSTQKWVNANESGGSGSGHNVYTAYYLEQTGSGSTAVMSIVINEAEDSSFELNAGDLIVLTIGSSDVLPAKVSSRVKMYANDEETVIVSSQPWNNVSEQFVVGHPYTFRYDNDITLLTSNVHTVAQVNSLIDAKINALGNAEQEEF